LWVFAGNPLEPPEIARRSDLRWPSTPIGFYRPHGFTGLGSGLLRVSGFLFYSVTLSLGSLPLSLGLSLTLNLSLSVLGQKEERRKKEKKRKKERDPVMQGIREKMREKLLKCPSH
jgi:hypothetical protein